MRSRRWPLHPQPAALESLSSWLMRLAGLYGMPVKDLLRHNLGLVDLEVPELLDWDPPAAMLLALAERTGVGLDRLRAMTLAGWAPWLFDHLHTRTHQARHTFDTYVRDNSVLLAPGVAGTHHVGRWKTWRGPWLADSPLRRVCPQCFVDADRGDALVWQLPLMTGCVEHGCRLENTMDVQLTLATGQPLPVSPVAEPAATVDRYTQQALLTGQVVLPGRTVHAGVWFGLLRSLLHELTLAPSTLNRHGRSTVEQVWQAAGQPERAGLTVWRPYEQLPWATQEVVLHATGTALALAADVRISPRGVLGAALHATPHRPVYEGDKPAPDLGTLIDDALAHARRDRDAARQLLTLLTFSCRTLARFEQQRTYLFSIGIPADFLPSARELGRTDLA
jgi:hypothetical protein